MLPINRTAASALQIRGIASNRSQLQFSHTENMFLRTAQGSNLTTPLSSNPGNQSNVLPHQLSLQIRQGIESYNNSTILTFCEHGTCGQAETPYKKMRITLLRTSEVLKLGSVPEAVQSSPNGSPQENTPKWPPRGRPATWPY